MSCPHCPHSCISGVQETSGAVTTEQALIEVLRLRLKFAEELAGVCTECHSIRHKMECGQKDGIRLPGRMRKALGDFARNGRWGCCGACMGMDPAQCEFTEGPDHRLTRDDLDRVLGHHLRNYLLRGQP